MKKILYVMMLARIAISMEMQIESKKTIEEAESMTPVSKSSSGSTTKEIVVTADDIEVARKIYGHLPIPAHILPEPHEKLLECFAKQLVKLKFESPAKYEELLKLLAAKGQP